MMAVVIPRPPWCPPPSAEAYNNQPQPFTVVSVRGRAWLVVTWDAAMVVSGCHGGGM